MQTSQNVKIVEPDSSKWYNLAFYIYKNIGIKSIFPCATSLNTRVGCHSSSPASAEPIQQGTEEIFVVFKEIYEQIFLHSCNEWLQPMGPRDEADRIK